MKHLLLTAIAAVVLVVGCGCKPAWLSIFNAADQGNIEAVKKHLANGADVNTHHGGSTALHWAAFKGHKEIAELLIENGADVNAMFIELPATPLDVAEINDYVEIKKLLRKNGGKTAEELKTEGK